MSVNASQVHAFCHVASVATSGAVFKDGEDSSENKDLLQIVLDFVPSLPVMVIGDALRLKQV